MATPTLQDESRKRIEPTERETLAACYPPADGTVPMIFVDNMRTSATVRNDSTGKDVSGSWSHLTTDGDDEELHKFAEVLGLKRSYHQPSPPHSRSHYDVTERKRKQAIRLGAIAVRIGYEPWRGLGQRRKAEDYLRNGEAYADDAEVILPPSYIFPEPPDRERKLDALEAGLEFDPKTGEPVPV